MIGIHCVINFYDFPYLLAVSRPTLNEAILCNLVYSIYDVSVGMMAPQLWRWREHGIESEDLVLDKYGCTVNSDVLLKANSGRKISLIAIPAETLALWDDVILVADLFDNIIIWIGSELKVDVNDIERDALECIKVFVKERSNFRFPAPRIHFLREGESMSRRLTSRLVSSHKDPPEQQVALFPALSALRAESIAKLRNKFQYYDSTNDDSSFRSWFWDVASASAEVSEFGKSLCELDSD